MNYPTIVNNIPKDKNKYELSMDSYALIDNKLAAAQLAIGESSNLAQVCLTYTYNYEDPKYEKYACILSVIAQIAIDSAKRSFDISIPDEIKRIKEDMEVRQNGYPMFWSIIRRNFREERINPELICPMNYVYNWKADPHREKESTLPISHYFIKTQYPTDGNKKNRRIEQMIEEFSLDLYRYYQQPQYYDSLDDAELSENYLLLRSDFDDLIVAIRQAGISRNYRQLMAWLINRAFYIGAGVRAKRDNGMSAKTDKNKAILMKVLYTVNPEVFLSCFKEEESDSISTALEPFAEAV